jgi:hypothetical protein
VRDLLQGGSSLTQGVRLWLWHPQSPAAADLPSPTGRQPIRALLHNQVLQSLEQARNRWRLLLRVNGECRVHVSDQKAEPGPFCLHLLRSLIFASPSYPVVLVFLCSFGSFSPSPAGTSLQYSRGMKKAATPPSSSAKATSIQPVTTTASMPQTAESKTMPSSTTTSLASSPASEPPSHTRSHSFPFHFHGYSLSQSTTHDSIFHPHSRSRSKSPSARRSPPNSLPKATPITTMSTHIPSQPKRNPCDTAVSPIASSPTSKPSHPKKAKPSPASTSHCGRHSNDWLFGGFSVTEAAKRLLKDEEEEEEEEE